MTVLTDVRDDRDLTSPTGRFCTWLILGDSELALGMRARGWDLARRLWGGGSGVTDTDRMRVRDWLDAELNDVFDLAAYGKSPPLREEALRVRVGVRRPQDVETKAVVDLLRLLYRVSDSIDHADGE